MIHSCAIYANSTYSCCFCYYYTVVFTQLLFSVSVQLLRKDTSKNCLDIGHPSPPCPHLVSDLSLAPLLISQGIKSHSPSVFVLPTHCHGLRTLHPFSKQRSEAQMLTR